ncbi:MAG TPA: hypothetical protein VK563_23350 [Puia sp.]|nr:hypothetical protein [Puia sp.]
MNLDQRIDLLARLGNYMLSDEQAWQETKQRAGSANGWFRPEFIEGAVRGLAEEMLQKDKLTAWVEQYGLPPTNGSPKNIGLVMAGNIPLVGFHDFLCIFITGHRQTIRPSAKDEVLIKHLVATAGGYDPEFRELVSFAERLNGCDAYIATGSNNSARYFDFYFGKYPHIIRRNRTSVAILDGHESGEELEKLADDVYLYFGLGCRNVTKLYVPENYDFLPLLETFKKYNYLADYAKYKHNYDYYLTILILNKKQYMSNESILLEENPSFFSPISALYYEVYTPGSGTLAALTGHPDIQCIVGRRHTPFGRAQRPGLTDYADGVDTLGFLTGL